MGTNVLSAKDIKREKHVIDASGKILGRLASTVATFLMGKHKPNYVPYLDMGDFVVVTNASDIKVTGKKAEQKKYYSHSGYPGGLRTQTYADLLGNKPEEIIKHAIRGMLPNNKLRSKMLKKLFIFADANHPYKSKAFASSALKKQLKEVTEVTEESKVTKVQEEVANGQ